MNVRKTIMITSLLSMIVYTLLFPTSVAAVSVSAKGAILIEQETGRVLYEHNAHEVYRIASITKVMTAILAIESGKLDKKVKVSKDAIYTEGSSIFLQEGERITLEDLLYGLMLRSGNDAAVAIAEHVGGSLEGFVFLMNQKAEEIGMTNTKFANPHGLDDSEDHYSTAYDMALLMRYAMKNKTFREISGTKVYKFDRETGPQKWTNKNRLLTEKYKYCTGGKTGFTKRAGRTLITTATKDDKHLIAVTLNAPDDWNDHINMYEHGFDTYANQLILDEGFLSIDDQNLNELKEKKFYIKEAIEYPLSRKEESKIKVEYKLLQPKVLKNMSNGQAGIVIVYLQGEPIKKTAIYIKDHQKKNESWWKKIKTKLFSKVGEDVP